MTPGDVAVAEDPGGHTFMMPIDNTIKPWKNEQSLRVVLDAMPVGVSWATLDDGKIVYVNRRFTEIFGYVVGDLDDISAWLKK